MRMQFLLVEDEARLRHLLAESLRQAGHDVVECEDAESAVQAVASRAFGAILVDWGLPGMDGLALIQKLRAQRNRSAILLISARGTVGERVQGLNAGADDYLVKPIAVEEVLARTSAILRRQDKQSAGMGALLEVGDLYVQVSTRALRGPRGEALLTEREFGLFSTLLSSKNQVLSRQALREAVWGAWLGGSANVVDVYVGYLRTKVASTGSALVSIETVRGAGYSMRVQLP